MKNFSLSIRFEAKQYGFPENKINSNHATDL